MCIQNKSWLKMSHPKIYRYKISFIMTQTETTFCTLIVKTKDHLRVTLLKWISNKLFTEYEFPILLIKVTDSVEYFQYQHI